jgi:hypothetical protein
MRLTMFQDVLVPHDEVIKQTERILKYLIATKDLKLFLRKNDEILPLIGFSDADWSGDKIDYISVSSSLSYMQTVRYHRR